MSNILNREKRTVVLSLLLGDGSLHNSDVYNSVTGYLTIKHSTKQKDYVLFKKQLLEKVLNKTINLHDKISYVKATNKSYDQVSFTIGMRRFRSWYKMFYPNRKKDLSLMLKFITDPVLAATLWLGDDGSVNNAFFRKKQPELGLIATGLIIYCCDQNQKQVEYFKKWFKTNFNVDAKISWMKVKYKNEYRIYPNIRFNLENSLKLWEQVRKTLLEIPSMAHKFRRMEERYQKWLVQPPTSD